jgi:predicted O-methyltransferase YrrM
MNPTPKFHCIVGTMRSGTSLLGHLLAEAGWVRYAGESHVVQDGPEAVAKAWELVEPHLPPGDEGLPFCDKALVPADLPGGGAVMVENAERIYLLLRHPMAVWRSLTSLTSLHWPWAKWEYLNGQLRAMKDLLERCPAEKLLVISYYDLTSGEKREELFGRRIDEYHLLPKTGADNWGDPEALIRSGKIRALSLQEDLDRAIAEVGGVVKDEGFLEAMRLFEELTVAAGRLDLLGARIPGYKGHGPALAGKYVGLKKWGWYFGLGEWQELFYSEKPVRVMEIGAFDGVSANMMLDHLFPHPESRVCCIDPFLPDPTTPEVSEKTREEFFENLELGGHREQIEILEGRSVEVLAWLIVEEGYWDSFDFIYIDGSHLASDVLTDAVMSWNLLKYGGVMAFDDYEWQPKRAPLERPKAGIDAFASVFGPQLRLVKDGYRRIWQKVPG